MPAGGLLTIAGLGLGLAGSVGKGIQRGRANRELRELMKTMPQYKENPLFAQRLGLAQQLLNARMPGAAAAERNIYQTQANQMANVQRGATSGSDVLLAGAGAAGQAGQAFNQLGQMEAADYQRRYGNLAQAQDAQAAEQQRLFEDQLRRYQMQTQLQGAIQENRAATFGDISNFGMGVANIAASGGFNSLAGKTGNMGTLNKQVTQAAPISTMPSLSSTLNVPAGVSNYMANYGNQYANQVPEYIPSSLVGNWWTR
jgi:hypothetical protein